MSFATGRGFLKDEGETMKDEKEWMESTAVPQRFCHFVSFRWYCGFDPKQVLVET
jgi:hypothetical protein